MAGDNACPVCGSPIVPNDAGLPHGCLLRVDKPLGLQGFGDQRIAALEAAVAKAEGELIDRRELIGKLDAAISRISTALGIAPGGTDSFGMVDRINDLRTQLTARDVAGAAQVEALEAIVEADGEGTHAHGEPACFRCFVSLLAHKTLATAPAAWRK